MNIRYIQNKDIDKEKWDACIFSSSNGLVYATYTYLSIMSNSWDALVLNDYEAVMPLPFRKKFGIHYVYPPAFTQQLGIIYKGDADENLEDLFIKSIPVKFKYAELNLNAGNTFVDFIEKKRKNYLLPLCKSYDELNKAFSRSAKRNIKKAIDNSVQVSEVVKPEEIIHIHRERFKDNVGSSAEDYDKFLILVNTLERENKVFKLGAYLDGKLIAGSIFLLYKNRITFIVNGNSAESLNLGATHLLLDTTIKKFADSNYILDFEGSDTPDFARFYEQYGATPEYYNRIKISKLSWYIKWFKK